MCEWSACGDAGAHMAHIRGSGAGGSDSLANVMFLCVLHHDILDGRTDRFRLREIEALLMELVARR